MKTNDLRELIQAELLTVCDDVSYNIAPTSVTYPHIVWTFSKVDIGDLSRDDLFLDIDIWDRGYSAEAIEDLADKVEALFNAANLPQDTILPTFYRSDRKTVIDEDKMIRHRILTFNIQNYER